MKEKEVKRELRNSISNFCRWRISAGLCADDECEFCPANDAFDMARDPDEEESLWEE